MKGGGKSPEILETLRVFRSYRQSTKGSIGFFPTMGALHEGHAASLKLLRKHCDSLVLSIFVNPTQFGPREDFQKYPRTLERDLEIAKQAGVDAVFVPEAVAIYPDGYSTNVEESRLSQPLCGKFREGHFKGVTTVVLKLLNIVQPTLLGLGLKDAQQFFVVSKMIQDLNLDVRCVGLPLRREVDGLALSSRNAYLSAEDRKFAPRMYLELKHAKEALEKGVNWKLIQEESQKNLARAGFEVQYFECVGVPELGNVANFKEPLMIAAAAKLGVTRLIDNLMMNLSHDRAAFEFIED